MQTIASYPYDDAALANPKRTGNHDKIFTILGWHPQDELARRSYQPTVLESGGTER